MQEIFKFPFGLLLWALAERIGSLKKTKVASLPRQLYGNMGPIDSIIKEFAMIVDGMSFVKNWKKIGYWNKNWKNWCRF